MDWLGKKELLEFYDHQIKRCGYTCQALRWTPEGQRARYSFIRHLLIKAEAERILDFGCGFGDLYGYLKDNHMKVEYTGIDINEKMVQEAKRRYPDARFLCLDIEEENFKETFDAVIVCGVFNLRVAGIRESFRQTLHKLFGLAEGFIILDLLTYYVKQRDVQLHLVKPSEVLDYLIESLSPYVFLYHRLVEDSMFFLIFRDRKLMNKVI
ncbi:MAG: class I SAM-dependent methyltransferase [Nitrospirae bacterium]|nr:class I SAM-dependent methyltransferase [Nitrospirota bacterium]